MTQKSSLVSRLMRGEECTGSQTLGDVCEMLATPDSGAQAALSDIERHKNHLHVLQRRGLLQMAELDTGRPVFVSPFLQIYTFPVDRGGVGALKGESEREQRAARAARQGVAALGTVKDYSLTSNDLAGARDFVSAAGGALCRFVWNATFTVRDRWRAGAHPSPRPSRQREGSESPSAVRLAGPKSLGRQAFGQRLKICSGVKPKPFGCLRPGLTPQQIV